MATGTNQLVVPLDKVQEAEAKKSNKSDSLNKIVEKGLKFHKNPSHSDLIKSQKKINQNILEARALKELREKPSDSDFDE